jgi:ribosomal protein S18 acetylase RimI-like enzyme
MQPGLRSALAMSIRLEPFTNSQYAAARALWEATDGVGLSEADSEESTAQFLARNPGTSYVAMDDGKLVATILVGHDGRRGLIHHLAVAASHRRQGIGKRLVAEGLAALGRERIQKCHLLVFAENAEGREFWRMVGANHRDELLVYSLSTA